MKKEFGAKLAGTLISGEPMTLSLTFVAGGLTRLVLAIVLAAAAISIYLSVRRFRRNRRRHESLPAASWPALHHFELNLTSLNITS